MDNIAHRHPGDLLELLFSRGVDAVVSCVSSYPACKPAARAAILLGCLAQPQESQQILHGWAISDRKAKWALMLGLAEMGAPQVEGFFLNALKGRGDAQSVPLAVRALGRVGAKRSVEALSRELAREELFDVCCQALGRIGTPEAFAALLPHADREEPFRALAENGAPQARARFLDALDGDSPGNALAAGALGRIGLPEDAPRLIAHLASGDAALARTAFEAYAAMDAPEGVEPLLAACRETLHPWMVPLLGALGGEEVEARLLTALGPRPTKSIWKKLLFWKRDDQPDRTDLYAALAGSHNPHVTAELAARLKPEMDRRELRAILAHAELIRAEAAAEPLTRILRGRDHTAAYHVASAWSMNPSTPYFTEALRQLRLPGFTQMDQALEIEDEESLLAMVAHEENPCLLLGNFLDSELVALGPLVGELSRRFVEERFPPPGHPQELMTELGGGFGPFLRALDEAHQPVKQALGPLWRLLLEREEEGGTLFELFWCGTGHHRGGLQRLIYRRMRDSVDLWIKGQGDRFIETVDPVAQQVPAEGLLHAPLKKIFDDARTRLMAECKDVVVWVEGGQRGDMVLVEKL